MPQKSDNTVHILEGRATLYQRPTTPYWFVRYKVDKTWLRTSTKKEKLNEAKEVAVDLVTNAWFRQKNNLPTLSKKFKSVALLAIKRMEEMAESGHGKPTFNRYIQAINSYLIPFFKQYNINSINYEALNQFYAWRINKMGKNPSASAINTHNSAMNRVMDEALLRGFITKSEVPHLQNKGEVSERRADFTNEEYVKLFKFMRKWAAEGRNGNEKYIRNMLRNYVLILANTGLRAGTETSNLKWRHITFTNYKNKKYLRLDVNGKTGRRQIQVRHSVARYLQRIQETDDEINHLTFNQLITKGVDKFVFRKDKIDMATNFGRMFVRLLKKADLLVDKRTDKKRTLYCLRHYYATQMLTRSDVTAYQLAEHMGTSIGMIKAHYGHLDLLMVADKFVGEGSIEERLVKKKRLN